MASKKIYKKEVFSFSTIKDFDKHILASIPGYYDLVDTIVNMSEYFIQDGTSVYDIGCSTGRLIGLIDTKYTKKDMSLIGIEKEPNFTKDLVSSGRKKFYNIDVLDGLCISNASMVTSVFTLQFIPLHQRVDLLHNIFKGLNAGGCLVLAEKLYASSAKMQEMFTFLYYDFKRESFTYDRIMSKEKDLRKIMFPVTWEVEHRMLEEVGFRQVEIFWKNFNFAGIIAIKE